MTATNVQLVVPYATPTSIGKAGGIYRGNGSPTAAFKAPKGSQYIKADASTTTDRLWVAADSAGTWVFVTTSA